MENEGPIQLGVFEDVPLEKADRYIKPGKLEVPAEGWNGICYYTAQDGQEHWYIDESERSTTLLLNQFFEDEDIENDPMWRRRSVPTTRDKIMVLLYDYVEWKYDLPPRNRTRPLGQQGFDLGEQTILKSELSENLLTNSKYWEMDDDLLLTINTTGSESLTKYEFDHKKILQRSKLQTELLLRNLLGWEDKYLDLTCQIIGEAYDRAEQVFENIGVRGIPFVDFPVFGNNRRCFTENFNKGRIWQPDIDGLEYGGFINGMTLYLVLCDKYGNINQLTSGQVLKDSKMSSDRQEQAMNELVLEYTGFFSLRDFDVNAFSRPRSANMRQCLILEGMRHYSPSEDEALGVSGVRSFESPDKVGNVRCEGLERNGLNGYHVQSNFYQKVRDRDPGVRIVVPLADYETLGG
ncbi:MAG: hypothetical protein LBG75_01305 [Candidatus Nomurabacteria bacterium]|jgi:hypothetical protein|nr:hypothetical protein [Candidatus Nomurabacteria bacterium]